MPLALRHFFSVFKIRLVWFMNVRQFSYFQMIAFFKPGRLQPQALLYLFKLPGSLCIYHYLLTWQIFLSVLYKNRRRPNQMKWPVWKSKTQLHLSNYVYFKPVPTGLPCRRWLEQGRAEVDRGNSSEHFFLEIVNAAKPINVVCLRTNRTAVHDIWRSKCTSSWKNDSDNRGSPGPK